MSSKQYIIKKIDEIVSGFKNVQVFYQYDNDESTHYIKIIPAGIYNSDKEYIDYENKFILDFISKFPNEEIVFLTENDIIDIEPEKIIYHKTGIHYKNNLTTLSKLRRKIKAS